MTLYLEEVDTPAEDALRYLIKLFEHGIGPLNILCQLRM
jgi:hypothetical protein